MPPDLVWLYVVPFAVAGVMGVQHVSEIPSQVYNPEVGVGLASFTSAWGYIRDLVVRPLFLVVFALLLGAAVARSRDPGRFLAPLIASVWTLGLAVVVFVVLSGAGLSELAGAGERGFLSPLGLHANELGRMFAVAYGLLLFTFFETRDFMLRGVLIAT